MATVPYYLKKTDGAYLRLTTGARLILDYETVDDDLLTHILELDTTINILDLDRQADALELKTIVHILDLDRRVDIDELDATTHIVKE